MARLWSIRKSSEKLVSFSGEAGEASFSELFGVIEQSFLELFGAFPVIERTLMERMTTGKPRKSSRNQSLWSLEMLGKPRELFRGFPLNPTTSFF